MSSSIKGTQRMAKFFLLILVLTAMQPSLAVEHSFHSELEKEWPVKDLTLLHRDRLNQIYQANNNELIWTNPNTQAAFESLIEVVALADLSDHLSARLIELKEARIANQAQHYDLLATDTLLSYIGYVENSLENGKAWYFGARVPNHTPPFTRDVVQFD